MPKYIGRPSRSLRQRLRLRAVVKMPAPKPDPPAEPYRPSAHFVLLLSVIVIFSYMAWLYSDLFATVSSALALTVLAGALPTLKGFMSRTQQKNYSEWLERVLFQGVIQRRLYIAAIAGMLIAGLGVFHPVMITSGATSQATTLAATLEWTDKEATEARQITTSPGQTVRLGMRRPVFGGPDRIALVANNLPRLTRELSGLGWLRIPYPTAFWEKPVILLRPGPSALVTLRTELPRLSLTRLPRSGEAESCVISERYLGEPLWLGTGGRVLPVQASTVSRWREQAELDALRTGAASDLPTGVSSLEELVLASPISDSECLNTLAANDSITWSLDVGSANLGTGDLVLSGSEPYPIDFLIEVEN